jgi:plasmid stabilization system protein ParE
MKRKTTYFDRVKVDVKDAKDWYRYQRPGLEKEFAKEIKKTILKLAELPVLHAIRYKNIRIAHPRIFPYGIHYYFIENKSEIVIVAIIHNSRNPDEYPGR